MNRRRICIAVIITVLLIIISGYALYKNHIHKKQNYAVNAERLAHKIENNVRRIRQEESFVNNGIRIPVHEEIDIRRHAATTDDTEWLTIGDLYAYNMRHDVDNDEEDTIYYRDGPFMIYGHVDRAIIDVDNATRARNNDRRDRHRLALESYTQALNSTDPLIRLNAEERINNHLDQLGFHYDITNQGNTDMLADRVAETFTNFINMNNAILGTTEQVPKHLIDTPPLVLPPAVELHELPSESQQFINRVAPVDNDLQNVHDSITVKTVKEIVRILSETKGYTALTTAQMRDELLTEIKRLDKEDDSHRIMHVYDHIQNTNTFVMAYNCSVADALRLVWDLTSLENIIDKLLSCYEHGILVCTMGKFNRVISAVEGATFEHDGKLIEIPFIRTKGLLRRELLDYAANYKQSNPNMDDETAKQNIKEDLYARYLPTEGSAVTLISREQLDAEFAEWLDYI